MKNKISVHRIDSVGSTNKLEQYNAESNIIERNAEYNIFT